MFHKQWLVVEVRNATQIVSLMHNMQESQPFGDSVTETIGDIISDSDIKEALKSIKQLLLGDIQTALKRNTTSTNMRSTI